MNHDPNDPSTIVAEPKRSNLTLRSWRKSMAKDVGLQWKVLTLLALTLVLGLFGFSLLRPFSRADLQVLVLGPTHASQATLATLPDVDLPLLFSIANAKSIEKAILENRKEVLLSHEPVSSLSHSWNGIEKSLQARIHDNSTLVVYVSGVLAIDKAEPSLCDNSRDAVHAGIAMNLVHLVSQLQRIRCRQILLCVDATMPISSGPSYIATSIAWKNLGVKLEKLLLEDGKTPVAVQLELNSIDVQNCIIETSPLAKKWCNVFTSDFLSTKTSLHDFQQRLSADKPSEVFGGLSSQSMRWMVSADWPLDSHKVQLPTLESDSFVGKPEPTSLAAANISTSLPDSESNETDFDLEPASADTSRLIALCETMFSKWRKTKHANPLPSILLPVPLTRQQTDHFAYHSFLSAYLKLKSAYHLVPSIVDHAQMRLFTQCLYCFDQGLPLPSNAPVWLRRLPETSPKPIVRPSSSVVVNATLEALGILKYPAGYSGDAVLYDIAKHVSNNSTGSVIPFKAWIEKLPEESLTIAEVAWSQWVLSQPDITWELQQRFIEARLLASRLACDPLTVEWSSELLQEADAARVQAERSLADRSKSDWEDIASHTIRIAISKFREGIELVVRVRARLQKYNDEIISNPLQSSVPGDDLIQSIPIADRTQAIVGLEQCSKLWFDALAPWNRTLAKQWVDGTAQTKSQLAAADRDSEQRIQSIVNFDRFAHTQIDALLQWTSTHASKIPFDSSLWIFVKRLWNAKPEQLVDLVTRAKPPMRSCVQLNLDRLNREQYGATSQELVEIETQMSWWSDVADSLGHQVVHPPKSTLRLRGDGSLDLITRSSLEACIEIEYSPNGSFPIELQADFDANAAEVHVDGKRMSKESHLTLSSHSSSKAPLRVAVAVQRIQGQTNNKPIMLIATRGNEQRRAVITLHSPHEPMVRVDFENTSRTAESRRVRPTDSFLFPNQANRLAIAVTNATSSTNTYSCRLLHAKSTGVETPMGTLAADEATRWLHAAGQPIAIAESKPILLAAGQKETISFASVPGPIDPSPPTIQKLLLEIKNDATGQVQFQAWTPRVVHPSQYVQPSVLYDAVQQSVTVRIKPRDRNDLPKDGAAVELELLNPADLVVLARASVQLHAERMESQTVLATSACRSGKALLCVTVDRWAPSFLYEIDLNRAGVYEPSKQFASLRLQLSDPRDSIVPQKKAVEVQVDAIMNDDCFEEHRDWIDVGFDRNGNRSLDDDVTMQIQGTKERKFVFLGADKTGELLVRAVVDSHRVTLPVQSDWNRWVPAMATLHRSNLNVSSNTIACVLDRVPPKIENLRILGRQPVLLGSPLCVELQVDDDGLSGGALVEGGWSTTGELEFYEQIKAVPAVYRERDRWLLTVPTDALPSGFNTLLVRARDRSGNVSRTYSVRAELLRQDEIDAREAAMTTTVQGDVMHNAVPQVGVTVRLLPKPPTEKGTEGGKEVKETKAPDAIATTRTDAMGRFVFDKATKGTYVVEFTGIVQGMRVKRTQELVVNPFSGLSEIHMRLDQKP